MFPQIVNGKVYVPITPTSEAEGVRGDAMIEMSPEDPEYERVKQWIEANGLAVRV